MAVAVRVAGAVVLAVVLAVAACGVSSQEEATVADADDVPFGLLGGSGDEPPPTALPPPGSLIEVYLVDAEGEHLEARIRSLAEADAEGVLVALEAGPTEAEAEAGLTSALPEDGAIQSVEVVGGVAAVDLDESFLDLDGTSQRIALGQVVYTLTARPGTGRVAFTVEGQSVDIPRSDGTLTSGSVSRDSYREIGPPS